MCTVINDYSFKKTYSTQHTVIIIIPTEIIIKIISNNCSSDTDTNNNNNIIIKDTHQKCIDDPYMMVVGQGLHTLGEEGIDVLLEPQQLVGCASADLTFQSRHLWLSSKSLYDTKKKRGINWVRSCIHAHTFFLIIKPMQWEI